MWAPKAASLGLKTFGASASDEELLQKNFGFSLTSSRYCQTNAGFRYENHEPLFQPIYGHVSGSRLPKQATKTRHCEQHRYDEPLSGTPQIELVAGSVNASLHDRALMAEDDP